MNTIKRQNGLVSLVATIIISILLTVIVVGMVTLLTRELRQAADADQSIRAYYAAEAGIEDGFLALKANPNYTSGGCVNLNLPGNQLEYTCQRITNTTNNPEGPMQRDADALQLDLSSRAVQHVLLEWNQDNEADVPFANPAGFPQGPWNLPAAMELTIASYPNGPINLSSLDIRTVVIKPCSGCGVAPANIYGGGGPYNASCATGSELQCRMYVSGFIPSLNYVFRLRARYNGGYYRMQFFSCPYGNNCSSMTIDDQFATIDVTARAGDVFRRVIQKVKIKSGVLTGLDYVLYSDSDICKDFKVRDAVNRADAATCPGPL